MIVRRYAAIVLLLTFALSPATLLAQTPAAQPSSAPQTPAPDPNDPATKT